MTDPDPFDYPIMSPHDCIRRAQTAEAETVKLREANYRIHEDRLKLRAALQQIADYRGEPSDSHAWDSAMRGIARAALGGKP